MANLNTTLRVGSASVEVSLVKVASKPTDAQHEVRRVPVASTEPKPEPVRGQSPVDAACPECGFTDCTGHRPPSDPFADIESSEQTRVITEAKPEYLSATTSPPPENTFTAFVVQQGVKYGDEWVDLTEDLKEIDEATTIEGMALEATVRLSAVPRENVRDSFFIMPKTPAAHKFCALVWHGLRETNSAAVVRWTKRTGQYLGLVVARGTKGTTDSPYLVVIQLEWEQNIKKVPRGARIDMESIPGGDAATNARLAMRSISKSASEYLPSLRDERIARRTELLNAARSGKTWSQPKQVVDNDLQWLDDVLTEVAP